MKNRLKELREEQGLSLRELSDATGMANSTLSQYETGRREPKLKTWEKLAQYLVKDLGVNPSDIALYTMLKVVLDKDEDDE